MRLQALIATYQNIGLDVCLRANVWTCVGVPVVLEPNSNQFKIKRLYSRFIVLLKPPVISMQFRFKAPLTLRHDRMHLSVEPWFHCLNKSRSTQGYT